MAEADCLPPRIRMHKDDRRAAILDEAIRIIGEQGYRGFSVNDLAKRCGLTNAGLLHHFVSKEGLLIAVLEERDRRDALAISARLDLRGDRSLRRDQVLRVLREIVAQNVAQPDLMRLYVMLRAEALSQDHPAAAYFREREGASRAMVAMMLTPHVADPSATAREITAAMQGLEVQWLREECAFDLIAAWEQVADKLVA